MLQARLRLEVGWGGLGLILHPGLRLGQAWSYTGATSTPLQ